MIRPEQQQLADVGAEHGDAGGRVADAVKQRTEHREDGDLVRVLGREQLVALEHAGALAVLTGAGISTPSGIPDYRGAEGSYSKGHEPMQHADFVRSARKRKRFWARSVRGYKYFSNRRPNLMHRGIAGMESGL